MICNSFPFRPVWHRHRFLALLFAFVPMLVLFSTARAAAEGREVLSLEKALEEAAEHNLDLKAARARLDRAHTLSRMAWAAYLPQLTAGGAYTRNNVEATFRLPTGYAIRDVGTPTSDPFDPTQPPGPSNPPGNPTTLALVPTGFEELTIQKKDQLNAQVQLSQALIAPALWPAIHNAYLGEQVAELEVESGRKRVLVAVAQLYYGAASLQQTADVQKKLLESARAREADARARVEAGAALKVALLRAQIDVARTEQDLQRAQNAYASSRIALATLLDREDDFDVERPASPEIPEDLDALEQRALEDRPDLRAAGLRVRLADGKRRSALMQYAPNLGLVATYHTGNVRGFTGEYDAWSVGLGLQWALYDGGLREAQLTAARADEREAKARARAAMGRARQDIAQARLAYQSALASKAKATEELRLARENMDLVHINVEAGVATYLDVADASAALAGAETGAVVEALNADLAGLELLEALNRFESWATGEETPVDPRQP